jgi:hypothetical protein
MVVGINRLQAAFTHSSMVRIESPASQAQGRKDKIQQPLQQGALVHEVGKHDLRKESASGSSTKNGSVEKVPFSSLRATAKQSHLLNANEIATSVRSSL